jgi:hypothetical protein
MGLGQRLITDFCPKPHSASETGGVIPEAPNNGASPVEMGLKQKFITEFCPIPSGALRAQLTLTGDVIPVKSNNGNRRSADKDTRLSHFTDDPSPVLTVTKARIVRNDCAHVKVALPKDLQKKLSRCGKVEVWHFASIKEEHPYNVEEPYIRIGTGRFYTSFYNSGDTALVKMVGERVLIVTKVGEHPRDYLQFRNIEYKSATSGFTVKTTKGRILPLSFYEQARMLFPSVIEVVGKAKRVRIPKKQKEKRYVSAPD